MSLSSTVFGSPGTTTVGQTPGTRPPGYHQAQQIFNWLLGLTNQPFPTYQGQVDPGLSPTMQDLLRRSQGYASAGAPEILQGVQGYLGGAMNANFLNPVPRIFGGATDYAGASMYPWNDQYRFNPYQRVGAGGPDPVQGSSEWEQRYGGGGQSTGRPPSTGGPVVSTTLPYGPQTPSQVQGQAPFFSDRQAGAKPMWDMGAGANRGQMRQGANGLEILLGTGQGGESYAWQPYTGDWGQQQNAAMFQRYGPNWTAGSGSSGGHSSDVKYWFEAANGRPPTTSELYDYYYGVKDAAPLRQVAKQQNARYDPSSAQYDPRSKQELVNLWKAPAVRRPSPAPPTQPSQPTGGR